MTDRRDDTLADLLLRWEEAFDHGDDIPAAVLCSDHPELVDEVQARIDRLKQMSWMDSDSDDRNSHTAVDDLISKTVNERYRVDTLIAEGGFGRVYKAFDLVLERHVALKVPKTHSLDHDSLIEEARRVARLRHPGIVSVHDVGRESRLGFIVSDLIDGSSLADVIESRSMSASECAELVARIADSLHYAHEQGFVHRDVKPANILLDHDGRPLITDFGISATTEELLQGSRATSGTLAYMAPEQVAGETQLIDSRTDIYSLGVVLYEMLTGQLPFSARTPTALREQILFRPVKPPGSVSSSVPADIEAVCLRCLSPHPADRYPSAGELAEVLRECVSESPRANYRQVMLVCLLLLVAIWLIYGGWMFLSPSDRVDGDQTSETAAPDPPSTGISTAEGSETPVDERPSPIGAAKAEQKRDQVNESIRQLVNGIQWPRELSPVFEPRFSLPAGDQSSNQDSGVEHRGSDAGDTPPSFSLTELSDGRETHLILCNAAEVLSRFVQSNIKGTRRVVGAELQLSSSDLWEWAANGGGHVTYKQFFRSIESVVIRGRIVLPSKKEFRISVGSLNARLNFTGGNENHFHNEAARGEQSAVIRPESLTPGKLHTIELCRQGADVVARIDGNEIYRAESTLNGAVTIYTSGNTIAVTSLSITGIPDNSVQITKPVGNIR